MAKSVHNDVLDAALNYIKTNATGYWVCSAQPTTFTEATVTYALADAVIDSGDFTGPAEGTASGRKLTVNQQADIPVDASDGATHIALVDTDDSKLLYVTTCSTQALTSGNTVTVPAFVITILDPS